MKSNKQRRKEIKQRRLLRAQKLATIDQTTAPIQIIENLVLADQSALVHNNTYDPMPLFYIDKAFVCKDCGSHELWTAKQQKWWYEIAKGNIHSLAIYCRPCRKQRQATKAETRAIHLDGIARKKTSQ